MARCAGEAAGWGGDKPWSLRFKQPSHMLNETEQPFFLQIVLLSVRFGLDPVRSCWAMPGLTQGRFWNLSCIKYSCPNWRMQCTPILSYLGWVSKTKNLCQLPLIDLVVSPLAAGWTFPTRNSRITRQVAFPKYPQPQLKSCVWFGFPRTVLLLTLIKHRKNKTAI